MLNINGNETDVDTSTTNGADTSDLRVRLLEELTSAMVSWSPRERFGTFRKWHQGALSLIHLNVLNVLEAEGPQPMHRLAELLDVSDASATGIVDRMEKRGLVERRHATDDRRLVLVHPGEAAADVFKEMQAHRMRHLRIMLDHLTAEELRGLLVGFKGMQRAREELYPQGFGMTTDDPPAAAGTPQRTGSPQGE